MQSFIKVEGKKTDWRERFERVRQLIGNFACAVHYFLSVTAS
jgi:hypothetical protein